MTQRTLNTTVDGRAVTALMGWDRPLQYHFMVVEYLDAHEESLYCNLDDEEAGAQPSLSYFAKKARALGIEIPQAMLAKLQADEALNLGNAVSTFDANGVETL